MPDQDTVPEQSTAPERSTVDRIDETPDPTPPSTSDSASVEPAPEPGTAELGTTEFGTTEFGTADFGTADGAAVDSTVDETDVDMDMDADTVPTRVSASAPVVEAPLDGADDDATFAESPEPAGSPASAVTPAVQVSDVDSAGEPAELAPGDVPVEPLAGLWPESAMTGLRDRWREVQLKFVDDPRGAAAEADDLVGEAVDTLTAALASQRSDLGAWRTSNDGEGDTERLRVSVTRYHEFLDRLLDL